jgi:hypothetical protein
MFSQETAVTPRACIESSILEEKGNYTKESGLDTGKAGLWIDMAGKPKRTTSVRIPAAGENIAATKINKIG